MNQRVRKSFLTTSRNKRLLPLCAVDPRRRALLRDLAAPPAALGGPGGPARWRPVDPPAPIPRRQLSSATRSPSPRPRSLERAPVPSVGSFVWLVLVLVLVLVLLFLLMVVVVVIVVVVVVARKHAYGWLSFSSRLALVRLVPVPPEMHIHAVLPWVV
eukprot:183403-Prorocentrum_minimum.AAC.1